MMSKRAGQRQGSALPYDVYAGLVETLFGTVGSFVSGIFGGLLVPVIAYLRTGDTIYLFLTIAILILSVLRIGVLVAFRRLPSDVRQVDAPFWEAAYSLGGVGFMAAVGLTAALLLYQSEDQLSALYGVVIALGCMGSVAGRNAGRPRIVLGQALGICAPVALVTLTSQDPWYRGLSFIFLLILTSVLSTTRYLNHMLVTALLSRREAEIQGTLLRTALNSMSHGLCMLDQRGTITVINQRLCDVLGLSSTSSRVGGLGDQGHPDALSAAAPGQTAAPADLASLTAAIIAHAGLDPAATAAFSTAMHDHVARHERCAFVQQMGVHIFLFRFEPMESGGSVMVVEDITEARRSAEKVERLAHFDSLTGLANRFQFQEELQKALGASSPGPVALLSIDLDRFKEVNDTLGHQLGDKLLREVSNRLQGLVRDTDLVARFGGDEFQILLRPALPAPELDAMAARLVARISEPYRIDDNAVSVGASVGIALAPQDAVDGEGLTKCADLALYSAKGAGRGTFRHFVAALDAEAHRKRRIDLELRDALAKQQIEVHYQPTVDAKSGRVTCFEALERWRHPTRGLISPAEFIPVAEETGLIAEIGEYVLRRACEDALSWPSDVRVAVNVSAKQFMLRQDLASRIMAILGRTGLPPRRLELEITESTLMDANEALSALANVGVRISLDDFGTGYSSLSYLCQFKIHKIKVDRSFIQAQDPVSLAIIDAVWFLAQALAVELVVEGVETEAQLTLLLDRGITLIQGYLFSRPRPLAEIAPLLDNVHARATSAARAFA